MNHNPIYHHLVKVRSSDQLHYLCRINIVNIYPATVHKPQQDLVNQSISLPLTHHTLTDLQGSAVHVPDQHGPLLVHGGHEDGALRPQHDPVHLEVHPLALDCEVRKLPRLK